MPARSSFARTCALAAGLAVAGCSRGHAPPRAIDATAAARPLDVIRRDGNHLQGAGSVYLAQHAHNPVDWYAWSPEALARARAEDKPIFLSIGYSSCHWCHVMEAEVFEKDDVAAFLNAHYVSIKVDREERPDLDDVYMRALLSMNGSGGWPMTLLLTPALKPFFGATYLPHDRFLAVVTSAAERFASQRGTIETDADQVQEWLQREAKAGTAPPIEANELRSVATSALEHVDLEWGGFRGATKFPTPVRWELLLHAARKWNDAPIVRAIRVTLDAMAAGGVRDPIGGGFHRYSTDPRWEIPHFEKMLYDNAQLAALYLEAGIALGERRYVDVGTDTLDFLLREMQAPGGGFYASFDADSGGREGAFYVWTRDDLARACGADDARVLVSILGIGEAGPFDGASAPNRRKPLAEVANATGRAATDVEALWAADRPKLFAARAARPHPRLDTKVVTAWNGLAIEALARGFEATGDARYRDAAVRAADWLWKIHRRPASSNESAALFRASNDGRAEAAGVLEDYAFFARGLVALFEATNDPALVGRALAVVKEADARFRSSKDRGWFGAEEGSTPFARTVSLDDAVEPSGSAALLATRVALGALTLDGALTRTVDATLLAQAGPLRASGMSSAGWLDAALLRVGPSYDLVVAGDDAAAVERLDHVRRAMLPAWAVGARVPGAGPTAPFGELVTAARGKTAGTAPAKAYVCLEGACKAPTTDPVTLRALLLDGWSF